MRERNDFFGHLSEGGNDWAPHTILLGDFNTVLDTSRDRQGNSCYYDSSPSAELLDLCSSSDLEDVWRSVTDAPGYTHATATSKARLDRIYLTGGKMNLVKEVRVSPCAKSDHWFVSMVLNFDANAPPKLGVWKLNERLLSDDLWCETVSDILDEKPVQNDLLVYWWDAAKAEIARLGESRGRRIAKETKRREISVQREMEHIMNTQQEVSHDLQRLQNLKAEWDIMQENKLIGAATRARIEWLRNHERPSKFFYALERINAQSKNMPELRDGSGAVLKSQAEIAQAVDAYYRSLFSKVPSDVGGKVTLAREMPVLGSDDTSRLNERITLTELDQTIKEMKKNKAPGADGLTVRFYLKFWDKLRVILLDVYNASVELGRLPPSLRLGHIILVPKTKNEEQKKRLDYWRPITLLNVDYKILAKLLANRLKQIIHKLVGNHQTCGIPGRTIYDNLYTIQALLDLPKLNKKNRFVLIQLDQSKAFDRVDHAYLFQVLHFAGVRGYMMDALKICYNGMMSRVVVNGVPGNIIPIQRSIRQGCPLSVYLYVLQLEPILRKIEKNPNIEGVSLATGLPEIRSIAYADDLIVVLKNPEDVETVLRLIEETECFTGTKINYEKSAGLWVGHWKEKPSVTNEVQWTDGAIKILGIWFGKDYIRNRNTEELMGKVEKKISRYKSRRLSFKGRVMIWNTYILSLVWYRIKIFPLTRAQQKRVMRLGALFIWNSKYEPVRRSTLTKPTVKGGLGMTDIELKVKAINLCLVKTLVEGERNWAKYYAEFLTITRMNDDTVCIKENTAMRKMPSALKAVLALNNLICVVQGDHPIAEWTVKMLYNFLCERYLRPLTMVDRLGELKTVKMVRKIFRLTALPHVRNVLFKFCLQILPTKVWLLQRGILPVHVTSLCQCGHEEEDQEHLFFGCRRTRNLWTRVETKIGQVNRETDGVVEQILSRPECEVKILGCALAAIWEHRNETVFTSHRDIPLQVRFENLWTYHARLDAD